MRILNDSRRLVTSILVIGLLAAAFSIVCAEGVHSPLPGALGNACAVMTHSDGVAAALGSESGRLVVPQLLIAMAGMVAFAFSSFARIGLVRTCAAQAPPDILHGRLRI